MENQLAKLNSEDREKLFKAPALVSLLAASTDGKVSNAEKADAIELSHLRTFTSPPILRPYYKEVEKRFKSDFEFMVQKYAPLDVQRQEALREEISKVYDIMDQLDDQFKLELSISLDSYARHVGSIHQNFLEFFMIPLSIKGITE